VKQTSERAKSCRAVDVIILLISAAAAVLSGIMYPPSFLQRELSTIFLVFKFVFVSIQRGMRLIADDEALFRYARVLFISDFKVRMFYRNYADDSIFPIHASFFISRAQRFLAKKHVP